MATKHAAELFALLVNDLHGELPSRILAALFNRGRSTIAQLAQYTALNPRHLKHGLSVLIQQNLIYHFTPRDSRTTFYEANPTACYNLVRQGKVLTMIGDRYGPAEEDVAQAMLLLGHVRIGDLEARVLENLENQAGGINRHARELPGGKPLERIRSVAHLHRTLHRMLRADLLDVVGPRGFQSAEDIYRDLESELASGASASKLLSNRGEQERLLGERFREAHNESSNLKRQLDPGPHFTVKRRRLINDNAAHAHEQDRENDGEGPYLDTDFVIRLNFYKCLVELRNQTLVKFAMDAYGQVTGQVFYALLNLLTTNLSKCGANEEVGGDAAHQNKVSTLEIVSEIDPAATLSYGIGKAKPEDLDLASAERIRGPPNAEDADSDISEAEEPNHPYSKTTADEDDDSDEDMTVNFVDFKPSTRDDMSANIILNGNRPEPKGDRIGQARQHLLVLAESRQRFVRHCGRQGHGQWTVDFGPLLQRLRETEMDAMIEQTYGRHGLRLTRILRQKGKVDERVFPGEALMKKSDMQAKLLAMQVGGVVDVQEVPKDNQRIATRTMFFWYFDGERCRANLLENIFKTMVRCFQRLEAERHKEQHLLSFVSRSDVMGREEEVMVPEHYNKYRKHLDVERKLLVQLMRLDEAVSILRDY